MTKRMLIDSTHAEETRVVVLDGNRLEDFDVETSTKQQLKGNIYLAKIVRVEPSLQAAFVEFGGGRHGFLAFSEIHPDYYQIPVADRKRLLEMQEAEAREEEEEEEREATRQERGGAPRRNGAATPAASANGHADDLHGDEIQVPDEPEHGPGDEPSAAAAEADAATGPAMPETPADEPAAADALTEAGYAAQADPERVESEQADPERAEPAEPVPMPEPRQVAQPAAIAQDIIVAPEDAQAMFPAADASSAPSAGADLAPELTADLAEATVAPASSDGDGDAEIPAAADPGHNDTEADSDAAADGDLAAAEQPETNGHDPHGHIDLVPPTPAPEHIGGELDTDDRPDRRQPSRFLRNYKIQEVMRRRQILLVQVVKEERGTKGAALTTYISLAGRFSVLMPNSPRGGGISRKITSAADRRRLKEITAELDLPRGMGLIVRTAGAARPKPEILRDCEYLLNQWDQIRDLTMRSMAPALIYEEASLIKRAIRDVYSRDVDEILVDGEEGWRAARDFMRMLMPAHAKKVQLWRDPQPLFAKAQVESQLDAMLQPTVQLRSGGYLVINQTEALVAIDVNSGRSTRERGIEETALRTNMEAAEEAARQLRLRDLAGLIVIDFIDMESRRNNAAVEKRLKDALKNDRARIQVGSISHFGLLEMSRQRLRPSLAETSFVSCPHCGGTGHMRSTESAALSVLRAIEDEGGRRRAAEIVVHVHGSIALYILNHKRVRLSEIEQRFGLHVVFQADETMIPPSMRVEKVRALLPSELPPPISQSVPVETVEDPDDAVMEADDVETESDADIAAAADDDEDAPQPGETAEEGEQRQRKRRRRRRGGRREDAVAADAASSDATGSEPGDVAESGETEDAPAGEDEADGSEAQTAAEPVDGASAAEGAPAADGERKRRGRRGGRRRRREPGADGVVVADGEDADGIEAAEPDAELPAAYAPPAYSPPVYSGPTPANPFGGDSNAFAFFDAVEEPAPVTRPLPATPPAPEPAPEPEPEPPVQHAAPADDADLAIPPVPDAPAQSVPPPVAAVAEIEAAAAEATVPHDAGSSSPAEAAAEPPMAQQPAEPLPVEPTGRDEALQDAAAAPVEAAPPPSREPVIGPAIVPIVLGTPDAVVAEKKRGWWRK